MKMGIYVRGIDRRIHGTPFEAANKACDHGVSIIPILVIWQKEAETKTVNTRDLVDYVDAFSDAGIDPWVWGYPWVGKERGFISRIKWAIEACDGKLRGILLDPELGYQFRSSSEISARRGADRLIQGLLDIMNENLNIGITSYGAAHVQRRFPWAEFLAGFGSPQFYTARGVRVDNGLKKWIDYGWSELLPSVPAYGANSNRQLDPYLDMLIEKSRDLDDQRDNPITGFLVWSWRQLDQVEWVTIKKWSNR